MGHSRDGLTELRCAPHAVLGRGGTPTHEGGGAGWGAKRGLGLLAGAPRTLVSAPRTPREPQSNRPALPGPGGPAGSHLLVSSLGHLRTFTPQVGLP